MWPMRNTENGVGMSVVSTQYVTAGREGCRNEPMVI